MEYKIYKEKNGQLATLVRNLDTSDYEEATRYFADYIINGEIKDSDWFHYLTQEEDNVTTGWYDLSSQNFATKYDEDLDEDVVDYSTSDIEYIGNVIDGFDRITIDNITWYICNTMITHEEIYYICKIFNINNYHINSDMSIDVDGDVDISSSRLSFLPLRFNKVNGNFNCSGNYLTSLDGIGTVSGEMEVDDELLGLKRQHAIHSILRD